MKIDATQMDLIKDLRVLYKTFEAQQKKQYNDRIILADRGSFFPLWEMKPVKQ